METSLETSIASRSNGSAQAASNGSPAPVAKLLKAGKNGYVVAANEMPGMVPEYVLGHGRLGLYTQAQVDAFIAAGGQTVDVDRAVLLDNLRKLEKEINSQLVGVDEAVHLAMLGLVTGDNLFYYSLPGASKSTIARKLSEGIMGSFFRMNMTPDMSKSDLFGPIDVDGIKQGKWTRAWSGLATCRVALLDEFFKGSPTSRSNILDVAEEHTVSDANGPRPCPLIFLMSASNELIDPSPRHAMWDRFLIRYELGYPNTPEQMEALFTSPSGRKPITVNIDPDEIILLQGLVELMGIKLPPNIVKLLVKVLRALQQKGIDPSPRRRLGWGRLIAAETLLTGASGVENDHLMVGRYVLWIDPKERKTVDDIVSGITSPERAAMIRAKSDLETVRAGMAKFAKAEEAQTAVVKLRGVRNQVENFVQNDAFADEKAALIRQIQELTVELTEMAVNLLSAAAGQ